MKSFQSLKITFHFTMLIFLNGFIYGQENAAPSMHLNFNFPSTDAILKMMKVKITQSAYASYFEVNWFNHGYAGLQQTPDNSYGTPNILLSSLWDVNTAAGIYSVVEYVDSKTVESRFGGEGDGWKTINPYVWSLNTWYNIVIRSWKLSGRLYAGTFINDLSTGKWLHTATISIPFDGTYLFSYNDAFLENWDGYNAAWNGSFIRKAFFKDCWDLNLKGSWEKNTSAQCSVNNSTADIQRNGIYHNSFDAGYDLNENAYFMKHGGSTTPSSGFNGGRIMTLPLQSNQGSIPVLETPVISSFTAEHANGNINVNWVIDNYKTPQLSSKLEIKDSYGTICFTFQDTLPQRRSFSTSLPLNSGNYTAYLTVIDIFNQPSSVNIAGFNVNGNAPFVLLSSNHLTVDNKPNSVVTFEINSNAAWKIEKDEDWLSANKYSGSGNDVITLTALENSTRTSRTCQLKIGGINIPDQTITVVQDGIVSSKEIVQDKGMKIYPVPTTGILNIDGADENASIVIFSLTGEKIIEKKLTGKQLDISSLKSGSYFLQITDNYNLKTIRIVK